MRRTWPAYMTLIAGAVVTVFPFLWMVLTSFKTMTEAVRVPPVWIPATWRIENYEELFKIFPFASFYFNTVVSAVAKTVGQLLLCSMAGYAFARLRFPGRNVLFAIILAKIMIPQQVYIVPQYLLMKQFGWLNSLQALIVPGLFSAFGTFLLRQNYKTLPQELEEAAKIDGCNPFQIYARIFTPMVKPVMTALAVIVMLWSWNDLLWPLVVNHSPDKMPLSVGLATLQGEYFTDFPVLMAGATLAVCPMIVLFFFLQRYFIEGISITGLKG